MADFRTFHCKLWEKEWYHNESSDGKAFYSFLFTNPRASVAGIYKIPKWEIAGYMNLPESAIDELLAHFEAMDKLMYRDGVMWVKKMREYQGSLSPLVQKCINKDFNLVPDGPVKQAYAQHYGYVTQQQPKPEPEQQPEPEPVVDQPDMVSGCEEVEPSDSDMVSDTVSDTISQPYEYSIDDTRHMTHDPRPMTPDTPTPRARHVTGKPNLVQRLAKLLPRRVMVSDVDVGWINGKIEDFGEDMVEKAFAIAEERTYKPDNPQRYITQTLETMARGEKPKATRKPVKHQNLAI